MSIYIQARELELQTHCQVKIQVTPTWEHGRAHEYHSELPGSLPDNELQPQPEAQPSTSGASTGAEGPVQEQVSTSATTPATPTKRHTTAAGATPQPPSKRARTKRSCNICKLSGNAAQDPKQSLWLGCSYEDPRSKKMECSYWVHQTCIGFYYKSVEEIPDDMEFYCFVHRPKCFVKKSK